MWTCPKCKAEFVHKNSAHSCVKTTAKEFLKNKPPRGVELFRHFVREMKKIGPVKLHPVKTRIALMVDVRFAAINKIGRDSIDGHFWLKEKLSGRKFYKVDKLSLSDFIHHFRIKNEADIDDEFRKYMKAAYAVGQRKHINSVRD